MLLCTSPYLLPRTSSYLLPGPSTHVLCPSSGPSMLSRSSSNLLPGPSSQLLPAGSLPPGSLPPGSLPSGSLLLALLLSIHGCLAHLVPRGGDQLVASEQPTDTSALSVSVEVFSCLRGSLESRS